MITRERWINRHWSLFSIFVLTLAAGWIWLSRPINRPINPMIPAPQQGFVAPGLTLDTLDGKKVSLSDLRGKVILINFWASWCPPCKAEMQAIQHTYEAYREQGLVVLAVNTTYQDDAGAARQFAQAEGLTFPLLADQSGDIFRLYQVRALPTSFFVDRQGKIQSVVIGGPMAEALIRSRIETLLKENQ
jgi:cytochrome c biogenesis protein CcmG, thiol:disulfide interchange protein DsbE